MPNIRTTALPDDGQPRRARLGELAGAEHLGLTVYQLAPGQAMHFHYHVQREELLVVLEGTLAVRTAEGWSEVPAGEVVAFLRGERGHENRGDTRVRLLMISERTRLTSASTRTPTRSGSTMWPGPTSAASARCSTSPTPSPAMPVASRTQSCPRPRARASPRPPARAASSPSSSSAPSR